MTSFKAHPELRVGLVQCALGSDDIATNVDKVEALVRLAAEAGASVILPPELFEGPYFCEQQREECFDQAHPVEAHPTLERFKKLSRDLEVVIPVSFFERAGQSHYNSLALIEVGELRGVYRKSHIPDGPGYQEKFYFNPGNTGFQVWPTRFGSLGVGICWDQWFPEAARAMMLKGAEALFYPTAIGNEPHAPELDTRDMWQRAMVGHAVSNSVPVIAANRVGTESSLTFYGSSFIADTRGDKVAELSRDEEGFAMAVFDRAKLRRDRAAWGFFRDRRPELYGSLVE